MSTRIEAPLLFFSLSPSAQHLLFLLLEVRRVMMDNSTPYFRIHRLRPNAWDHGSDPVKAACSQSVVRTREARPFLSEGLRVQLMFAGARSPCRSYQSRPVRAEISFFPPKVSSPVRNIVSRPFFLFGPLPFVFLFRIVGETRGNGEQQRILFWHDRQIFPPKMAKK